MDITGEGNNDLDENFIEKISDDLRGKEAIRWVNHYYMSEIFLLGREIALDSNSTNNKENMTLYL